MKKSALPPIAEFSLVVILILFATCSDNDNTAPPLVIKSFYPTYGISGTPVTIFGDQFIPTTPPMYGTGPFPNRSVVTFNGVKAVAKDVYQDSIGAQHIDTRVPAGATSGKITITANDITVSSLDDFIVTVPTYLSDVTVTALNGHGLDIAVDNEGSLYVTRNHEHQIIKTTADGTEHTLWTSATSEAPIGVVVDAAGNVFATVLGNYIIKISADGTVTTLAGSSDHGTADGQGASARFSIPFGIALDKDGNLYVADAGNYKIRKITPDGTVSTLAGSTRGYKDESGTNAQFESPTNLATDAKGNVYVTDGFRIRKVTKDGQVSTFAGSAYGYLDGTTANAQFNGLTGIVLDTGGNIYVSDHGNYAVRRIAADGTVVTVAGGIAGQMIGPGSSARFTSPLGITIDASGAVIYLAQGEDGSIHKILIH